MSPLKRIGLSFVGVVCFGIFLLVTVMIARSMEKEIDGRHPINVLHASWKEFSYLEEHSDRHRWHRLYYEYDSKERTWSFEFKKVRTVFKRVSGCKKDCVFCMDQNRVHFKNTAIEEEIENRNLGVFMFLHGVLAIVPRADIRSWHDHSSTDLKGSNLDKKIESLKRIQCDVLWLGVVIHREMREVFRLRDKVYKFSTWMEETDIPHLHLILTRRLSDSEIKKMLKT